MSANALVDTKDTVVLPESTEQEEASQAEPEFQIKHSYELMDQDLLDLQTPSSLQSVKVSDFKMKLAHLECLIMRQMNEKIPTVAREIAQTLYLDEDKQSMVKGSLDTPAQL